MAPPRSTKYRLAAPNRRDRLRQFVAALPGRLRRPGFDLLERLVFAPGAGGRLLRGLARRLVGRDLKIAAPAFDADFYLRQAEDPAERARAALDPALHYAVIGRARRRSPATWFDPIHYRRHTAGLSLLRDPFAHYLAEGRARGLSTNAVDGVRGDGTTTSRGKVLVLDHPRGGGSTHFIALFEAKFRAEGHGIVRLRHVAGTARLGLWDDLEQPGGEIAAPVFDLFAEEDRFVAAARAAGVVRLLVNHVIDRPAAIFDWIGRVAGRIGCPYEVLLHDFYAVCPRVNAVTGEGRYCGLAPVETCRACIAQFGAEIVDVDPADWRRAAQACLTGAERIHVPSEDTARRLAPLLPGVTITPWHPASDDGHPPEVAPRIAGDRPMRVVMIGALNVPKGSSVLVGLAAETRRRSAPISYAVIGPSDQTAVLTNLGVRVHGRYDSRDLGRLIEDAAPDLVFLPAIWPETWSFVLGHALELGHPVAVFDIGAPADRLRAIGRGHVLPLDLADDPAGLLDALLALRATWTVVP